jgi:hypothetical protein
MTQYLSLSNSKDKIGFWIGSLENVGQALAVLPHTHIKGHHVG